MAKGSYSLRSKIPSLLIKEMIEQIQNCIKAYAKLDPVYAGCLGVIDQQNIRDQILHYRIKKYTREKDNLQEVEGKIKENSENVKKILLQQYLRNVNVQ